MNTLTALSLLVAVITPLATMWGVNRQMRSQADRDAVQRNVVRQEARELRLREAYAKVLTAADRLSSAIYELSWYPKGRPWTQEVTVVTTGVTLGNYVPPKQHVDKADGDYSRVNELINEAQTLISEATIDIGMEHDRDTCLDHYNNVLNLQFHTIQTQAVKHGHIKDLPEAVAKFTDDQITLTRLARENLRGLVEATSGGSKPSQPDAR